MLNIFWSLSYGWGVIDVFVFNVSIFLKENNFYVMYSWNMFVWRRLSCIFLGFYLVFVRFEDKIFLIYYVNFCIIYVVFENFFYFGLNLMYLYIYAFFYWEKYLIIFWYELCLGKVFIFLLKKIIKMGNYN